MAKHAKSNEGVPNPDDQEPTVWLDDGVGETWRTQREKLGYTTRTLAPRVGVSHGTVSNVETGKQRTLPRRVYTKWLRVLFKIGPGIPEDRWNQLVDEMADADTNEVEELIALARIIKKRRGRD